jgi:hypothetical protein
MTTTHPLRRTPIVTLAAVADLVTLGSTSRAAELRAARARRLHAEASAHADELEHALAAARARTGELVRLLATGDPLVVLDAGAATRAKDGGRDGAERVARRLAARATAARALARLDDVVAAVYPRLVEADRRRAGG